MEKFSQAQFDAFGEAGLTREEALNQVHDFYVKEAAKDERHAYSQGLKQIWAATTAFGVLVAAAFPVWFLYSDYAAHQRYMDACSVGNAVVCLEGVQDQFRQANERQADAAPIHWIWQSGEQYEIARQREFEKVKAGDAARNYNRANQLLLAYRQATGQVLPAK
jgi:hypothetical protein